MVSRHRKLVARSDPSCTDLSILLQPVLVVLPRLLHFAITFQDGKVCFYLQNIEHIAHTTTASLCKLFEEHVGTIDLTPYSTVEGELQQEWRSKRRRGITTTPNANTSVVFVNPLGKESLHHISREFVVDLLKQTLNVGVFFKFGLKLYSLEQNMNFRARKRYKYVRVRIKDEWVTVTKEEAYDEILHILVEKTQEAVEKYEHSIPEFEMKHFNMFLPVIFEHKDSPVSKKKSLYVKDRNAGLNTIASSVNNELNRLRQWHGKIILV